MAKRRNCWICKTCGFKGSGPTSMNVHYKANPTHATEKSVINSNDRPKKRELSKNPEAIRARQYYRDLKSGKRVKNPKKPILLPATGCNYCPGCGLFLGPSNTAIQLTEEVKKG